MVIAAVLLPTAVGANAVEMVQLAPGAMDAGQVVTSAVQNAAAAPGQPAGGTVFAITME